MSPEAHALSAEMRRASIAVGAVLVVAVVAIRFHQDRPQPQRWRLLGPFSMTPDSVRIKPTTARLGITVDSGRCIANRDLREDSPLDRIEVDETETDVTVTAYVDPVGHPLWTEAGGGDCLTTIPARVDLDQPLGSRTLHVGGFPNLDPQPR